MLEIKLGLLLIPSSLRGHRKTKLCLLQIRKNPFQLGPLFLSDLWINNLSDFERGDKCKTQNELTTMLKFGLIFFAKLGVFNPVSVALWLAFAD